MNIEIETTNEPSYPPASPATNEKTMENLINIYVKTICEYFKHMKQLHRGTLKRTTSMEEGLNDKGGHLCIFDNPGTKNHTYIILNGLNTIIHIFKQAYHSTKNEDLTYEYCQKGFYFYLEYIEQMNKTNTLHNLDNLDAIIYVYKKSLEDVLPVKREDGEEENPILQNIHFVTKCIFYNLYNSCETDVNLDNMIELTDVFLKMFLKLYLPIQIYEYIKNVQNKMKMNSSQYIEFLREVYKKMKKLKKNGETNIPIEKSFNEHYLEKCLNVYENTGETKIQFLLNKNKYGLLVQYLFDFL